MIINEARKYLKKFANKYYKTIDYELDILDKSCIEAFTKAKVLEFTSYEKLYAVNDKEQSYIDEFEKEQAS